MADVVRIPKAEKTVLIEMIVKYFYNERNEDIGDLAATLLLDFICEKIAPYFYNRGIRDSISYIQERVEDMYGLEKS